MIKVFFDTEFTHLEEPLLPEPAELISIGCVSEHGKSFYGENNHFTVEDCSEFVLENVLPSLEGGEASMSYKMLAIQLRAWIEALVDDVVFYSDSPYHDWPFVKHMFQTWGWPKNLSHQPDSLIFFGDQKTVFEQAVAHIVMAQNFRSHHALDDARAIKYGYERLLTNINGNVVKNREAD